MGDTVYAVLEYTLDRTSLRRIFTTEDAAQAYVKDPENTGIYTVEGHRLDDGYTSVSKRLEESDEVREK